MPLPKPPSKKGDLLTVADYEAQAAPRTAATRPRAAAEAAPAALELRQARATAAAGRPAPGAAPTAAAAPASPRAPAEPRARTRRPRGTGPAKLFVLDTNVLMHDPMSLFRFEEHDVFLPMITLEELDGHKKGMSEVARSVRQVSRELDALARFDKDSGGGDPAEGIPLAKTGHREAGGKLFFQTTLLDVKLPAGLPQGKADNQILGVVQGLREQHPNREVVLVSKDINMRVKARALGLPAEDYTNDKTLEDGDLLYTA
jgi:PhoH-like ATPase